MFLVVFVCLFHILSRISSKEQNEVNEHAFVYNCVGIEREWWHQGEQKARHTFPPRHHQVDRNRNKTVSKSIDYRVKSVSKDNTKLSKSLASVRTPKWHPFCPLFPLRIYSELPRYPCVILIHHSRSPTYQTKLIQESYNPTSSHRLLPDEHRRLQSELYELQRRWEAWGLVVPFLFDHTDPNVQFFGAHTAQVKISRDWYAPDIQSMLPHSLFLLQGELPNSA
jgi:hypothetical protein